MRVHDMTALIPTGYRFKAGKLERIPYRKSQIQHIKQNSKSAKKRIKVTSRAKAGAAR